MKSFGLSYKWWVMRDSNPRPPACKADALANWANHPYIWQHAKYIYFFSKVKSKCKIDFFCFFISIWKKLYEKNASYFYRYDFWASQWRHSVNWKPQKTPSQSYQARNCFGRWFFQCAVFWIQRNSTFTQFSATNF